MRDDLQGHGHGIPGPLDQDETDARPEGAPQHGDLYRDDAPAEVIAADGAEGIDARKQQAGIDALMTTSMEQGLTPSEGPLVDTRHYTDPRPAEVIAAEGDQDIDQEAQQAGMAALIKTAVGQKTLSSAPSLGQLPHDAEATISPPPPQHSEKTSGVLMPSQEAAWTQLVAAQTDPAQERNPAGPMQKYRPQSGDTAQQPVALDDGLAANSRHTESFSKVPLNPGRQGQPNTDHVRTEPLQQLPIYTSPAQSPRWFSKLAARWGGRKRAR